jgi:hypothetical protein
MPLSTRVPASDCSRHGIKPGRKPQQHRHRRVAGRTFTGCRRTCVLPLFYRHSLSMLQGEALPRAICETASRGVESPQFKGIDEAWHDDILRRALWKIQALLLLGYIVSGLDRLGITMKSRPL